jgi:tetratricopeptide (TPR) repeat protein
MAYYNMKKYDLTIEMLENFSSDDQILQSLSLTTIGDAFVQLNQFKDGLSYYENALSYSQNSFIKPVILLKAGDLAKELNNYSKAEKYFKEIKNDVPKSSEANLIDIRIEQVK